MKPYYPGATSIHRWIGTLTLRKEPRMKLGARVLAVLPLAVMALGLAAFQAGPALATGNADISISCGVAGSGEVTITNNGPGNIFLAQPLETHTDDGGSGKLKPGEPAKFTGLDPGTYTAHAHTGNNENSKALTGNSCTLLAAGAGGAQASTGFDALPYAAAAVLLLGLGGSMVLVTRRRNI
jgi:hypothetical protein